MKITKSGKLLKKQSGTGHLKAKWSSSKKHRKNRTQIQPNKGHVKVLKTLLAKLGKGIRHV